MRFRVLHVITGFELGGAEQMLARLLAGREELREGASVVGLRESGPVAGRIAELGVPVHSLGLGSIAGIRSAASELRELRQRHRPTVVQGWMYHGSLAAQWVAKSGGADLPAAWNIRQSVALHREKPQNAILILGLAALSRYAERVVYNSSAASQQHVRLGFRADRTEVIPNGFDLERFRASEPARVWLRQRLELSSNAAVVGMAARFDAMKGHEVFLDAAAAIVRDEPQLHFALCGAGCDRANPALARAIARRNLESRVHCMGVEPDLPRWFAALDVLASASTMKEGFSNSIAEAMCCQVACVVTDVGDSAEIVGETGVVVAPGDAEALRQGWLALLREGAERRLERGRKARQRIAERYSIANICRKYAQLYAELSCGARGGRRLA